MTDRAARLAAARLVDWRFLLPDPRLGRVGVAGPAAPDLVAALEDAGAEVVAAAATELATRTDLDVAVVGARSAGLETSDVTDAARGLRPGGWLLVDLPPGRIGRSTARAAEAAARAFDTEPIGRYWSLPNRREARRIVPLGDRDALRAAMSIHGSRPARRLQAAAARGVAGLGGAHLLGGEVTLMARRSGGTPVSGWPALEEVEHLLAAEGLRQPSWLLLTPRFPASAHVVLLLLADGAPALVAKIARLRDDDGPEREGRALRAFSDAGGDAGSAPDVIHAGRVGGHAVLLERAIGGRSLDRRRVRGNPSRWIGAVAAWTGRMPVTGRLGDAEHETLLSAPITAVRDRLRDDRTAALVDASAGLLTPLKDAGLPLVFEHGDLGHPNLVELADGRIGALDWELARAGGLPLNDLIFFLGYVALAIEGDTADPFGAFERLLTDPAAHAADAIRAEARRIGIDPSLTPALVVACWARATAGLASRLGDAGETAPERSIAGHRYYSLWSRAVEQQGRLAALLT